MRRGLAPSRERAQADITAGRVTVDGAPALKPARLVDPAQAVAVAGPPPRFVGRGGDKLDGALDRFGIDVHGATVLDAGASTGGFVDCLLQRGAARVVAVDVGRGQLDSSLRSDPRVVVLERTDIRQVVGAQHGGPFPMVTADLSFISLRAVLDALLGLCAAGGRLVLLVKPQFEAGRAEASRGKGVVRDPEVWRRVLQEVGDALTDRGAAMMEAMVSPLRGTQGNVEFFVLAVPGGAPDGPDPDEVIGRVVRDAAGGT